MIERISQKILDILAADSRLLQGGTAYGTGWTAYTREENGDTPTEGSVNLFDKPHDPDSNTRRPAIYVGTRGLEASDSLDFQTHSGGRVEYRVLQIPLVIAVQATGDNTATAKRSARLQRNQLRFNVKQILLDNWLADGYWYELFIPGAFAGGSFAERVWTTATGGNTVQVAEGMGIIPLSIRYSWSASSLA